MPVPTRPVDGAETATEWGQAVHDYTFAPSGCKVSGGDVELAAAAAWTTLPLDTPDDDPGGYLDATNDRVEIPTGGEGLYLASLWVHADNGATTDETRAVIRVNGALVARATEANEGSTAISVNVVTMLDLTAGDLVTIQAAQIGSGARADARVESFHLVRQGAELGAA